MNLKNAIFGGSVTGISDRSGAYDGSIQAWLPIKDIVQGVVVTRDKRFVKILELPQNGVGGADRLYGYSDLPWMQRCGHGDLHLKKVRHGHYQGGEQPNATFAVVFSGL